MEKNELITYETQSIFNHFLTHFNSKVKFFFVPAKK